METHYRLRTYVTDHRRRVTLLKRFIPGSALLLIGAILVWPQLQTLWEPEDAEMEALPQEIIMQNKIAQAQFVTSDDQGNTYRMQAQDAVQTDPHHVQVRDPLSNMIFEDGTKLSINAATGDYDQETGVFHYKETATLTSTNGYTLKTQELDVNVKDSTAVSKAPVKGQGAGGTINAAGGVVVDKKKKTIAFKGKTTLVIRHGS